MASGQSPKSATLPPRTQPPKSGNHRNKLSSPSFNRSLFGRLVQKLRFRNRDNDTEHPDSQNVEGLYFKRKMSPEHKDTPSQGPFARVDVRRSQSDRSYQKPVEMRKKNGAFPKLRRSRHSKDVAEVLSPPDKKPLASDIEVTNDFIISDEAGVDLDEGNKIEPISPEDMDPGYETLDEVREKMKNLKLKKLKEEEAEILAPTQVQHHRRSQSTGGQEEVHWRESNEFKINPREKLGKNSSHTDVNRPSSQNFDMKNRLLPSFTSNLLSVRSGSCPLQNENSLQTGIKSSQNKSENCISQGGVIWKETEDVYANPSIVHNKTKNVENPFKEPLRSGSVVNREESVDREPPPLPERQYSVQNLEDINTEEPPSNEDPVSSECPRTEDSIPPEADTEQVPQEVRLDPLDEDDETNGYSTCGSSLVLLQRRERIYEEIKDQDIKTSQCSCEEDKMCSVPYQSYIKKERPYEEVKDLQIDSGFHNSSSGSDLFAQVMHHFDSLSENVSSAGPCEISTEDLDMDCGNVGEKMNIPNGSCNTNSARTDSAITDLSISSDHLVSNLTSFTSSAEQADSVKWKSEKQKIKDKSDLVCSQSQSNSTVLESYETENLCAKPLNDDLTNHQFSFENQSPMATSYEDDADLVLESLESQTIPSGVSSIENLLDYERNMEDSTAKLKDSESCFQMGSSHVNNWEEIPYADANNLKLTDIPRTMLDDGTHSDCNDSNRESLTGSLIITEADLACDQNSAKQTETTDQSDVKTSAEVVIVDKPELPTVISAMGGDPEEGMQDIPDEETEVKRRSKGLPFKTIPSFYYDEEPVHMSLAELGMKEHYSKHSREREKQKKKQKEGKSSSTRQKSAESSSQVKVSGSSRVKVRDSSLRQTPVHKNPAARRTYPMGMAKSLETEKVHKDPIETKLSRSATSGEKPLRDAKAKSSVVEPITLPEIPAFNQNSDIRCRQDFFESMKQLKDCGWYWGPLSWDEAEIKLMSKPDGSFLVRDSSDERYILSLSFNMNGHVHHTRIEHHKGKFSFWSQPDSLGKSTIKDFIEQCVRNSRNGQFLYFIRPSGPGAPPMPVHLLHPVSRFRQMQSLQHMCRFQILQIVRRDHIDRLPIPTRIKDYLRESQYYVEYLED
ncbi:uncharacterized protein LOC133178956 [Saccostrea echinata]|uniref:uncharacterized protein LOC133178956 n=1 Tax=Saccostrea echinata TaxID=191078 RepID=UPI002A7FB995|nr:uncharacterized protein LOC133178956 [Saccostrea echinata]